MDLFDLQPHATPPERKKRKIGEHEVAHARDVKNDAFEEEQLEQCLKKWGLAKEFTVCGGSRLGCITCMKYDAWHEVYMSDMKKKKKNKKTKKKEEQEGEEAAHRGSEEPKEVAWVSGG